MTKKEREQSKVYTRVQRAAVNCLVNAELLQAASRALILWPELTTEDFCISAKNSIQNARTNISREMAK